MTRNGIRTWFSITATILLFILPFLSFPYISAAATADDLRAQIDAHNQQIASLEADIAKYQTQLNSISTQKQTLQSTLNSLDISRKKITASVSVAQNQISATQLEIQQLGSQINDKQASIASGTAGLGESLRTLNRADAVSLPLLVLSSDSLTTFWNDSNTIAQFQSSLNDQIDALKAVKTDLETAKSASEQKQAELIAQRNDLKAQQQALDVNRQQQATLLAQTKNQESSYQKLIAAKQAAKAQFAAELTDIESQLKYTLDPSTIPSVGNAVFAWPVKNVIITQRFGTTDFSQSGAYNGKGHNGIDLGVPIGTPIYAPLSGTILGTGNTDVGQCYSYGKWIMIQHPNGLSTIYGHLSQIDVSEGQKVVTGQLIGYSGFTGYATGPHLHFGVYVSAATQITNLGAWYKQEGIAPTTACAKAGVSIPVAPLNAYLNPLDYLPS